MSTLSATATEPANVGTEAGAYPPDARSQATSQSFATTTDRGQIPGPEARAPVALVTGIAIAGGALASGGLMLTANDDLSLKHAGLVTLHTGMVLAPLLAHGVAGEWARGAYFSIPPLLGAAGMATLLAVSPVSPVRGEGGNHRVYPIPITVSVLGGALGVFDAALVDRRRSHWSVSAAAGPSAARLWVGGVW